MSLADPPARRRVTPPAPPALPARRARPAVAGVLGELLLTAGVLIGLYVVWNVWWTDVAAAGTHADAVADFEAGAAPSSAAVAEPRHDLAPVLAVPPDGTIFALLHVPRWGEDYVVPIAEGVDRATVLDAVGIGHYPGTAMPGEVGNLALAGHRQSHGKPFGAIEGLRPGDALVVESAEAWYVYRVTRSVIVAPTAVDVIAPVPGNPGAAPGEAAITLTTCHPLFSTRERYVVHGSLASWSPRSDGRPAELDDVTAAAA